MSLYTERLDRGKSVTVLSSPTTTKHEREKKHTQPKNTSLDKIKNRIAVYGNPVSFTKIF